MCPLTGEPPHDCAGCPYLREGPSCSIYFDQGAQVEVLRGMLQDCVEELLVVRRRERHLSALLAMVADWKRAGRKFVALETVARGLEAL